MKEKISEKLKAFNKIYKEMDIVYHNYAKKCGLSDTAFWILYSVAESNEHFTQRDFSESWSFPPQTVNSSLKDLEKQGIIFLEGVPGNKKNKWIKLTKKGTELVEKTVFPLMKTEWESLEALSEEECELMMSLIKKYVSTLKENVRKISITQE